MKTKSSGGAFRGGRDVGGYRGGKVKSVFLLGFAAFALTAAGCVSGGSSLGQAVDATQVPSSVVPDVTKPTSQEEFFRNVKFVIDHDLLVERDFYTKENMLRFFAAINGASGVEQSAEGERVWFISTNFDNLFPYFIPDGSRVLLPDAQISAGVNVARNGTIVGGVNFGLQRGGLGFEQVNQIFGAGLTLDKTIPHQPPPPATGLHGNEGWKYVHVTKRGRISGYFQFNADGRLGNISLQEEK